MRVLLILIATLLIPQCVSYRSSVSSINCIENRTVNLVNKEYNIIQFTADCNGYIYQKESLAIALETFVILYADRFEKSEFEVWEHLRNLKIEVSVYPKNVKNVFDLKGKFYNSHTVSGLAINPEWVWVEIRTRSICDSSLIHELAHIIIWSTIGNRGDPDHEGSKFNGWTKEYTELIIETNEMLRALEI
jgi:hypothetical protein